MYKYFKSNIKVESEITLDMVSSILFDNKVHIELYIRPALTSAHDLLWYIMSGFNRIIEYRIVSDINGNILSTAQLIKHLIIFQFFKKGWHIGPCHTIPIARGHSFYPVVLKKIMSDYPFDEFYMIVNENNIASLRGVAKAGFKCFSSGIKILGFYIKL